MVDPPAQLETVNIVVIPTITGIVLLSARSARSAQRTIISNQSARVLINVNQADTGLSIKEKG